MKNDVKSIAHRILNCKYHIVFMSKYRHKVFYREKSPEMRKSKRVKSACFL